MSEKIQLQHPQGKHAQRIDLGKYSQVKGAIVAALQKGPLSHTDLMHDVSSQLPNFEGSVAWYCESVKLDLEARGMIIRSSNKPQKYSLSN